MNLIMKNLYKKWVALLAVFLIIASCDLVEVDRVIDPNNPSTAGVLNNATSSELQNLVSGLESVHRNYNNASSDWWALTGTISRELYYLNTSDPNFAIDWLQLSSRSIDAEDNSNFFVDASGYEAPYGAIRQSNLLTESVENSNNVTDQQKNGYIGFANTIKGYQFQIPLMHQFQNGIRVDVSFSEPLNPGGFLSYNEALSEIRTILDEAESQLEAAGSEFEFELTDGFNGFDTPPGMIQVNRAIAARLALYAEDWQGAIDALQGSFLNLNPGQGESELMNGPKHVFAGGNDQFNPYFFVPDASQNLLIVPHPGLVENAEEGDLRTDKFVPRTTAATTPDIPSLVVDFQDNRFASATSDMPFIRNEELILIYAEALAQRNQGSDLNDAVNAINIIRNAWDLSDFSSSDQSEIIDQVLWERQYSLWGEGHRWVDMRRYNRLDEIDTSIDGGRVAVQIGRPQGEIDWEQFSANN